jgi:hypothetical protein
MASDRLRLWQGMGRSHRFRQAGGHLPGRALRATNCTRR